MDGPNQEELSSKDFHLLDKDVLDDLSQFREGSEPSGSQKRSIFSSLFASAKCHIQVSFYNLYHSQPTTLPEFSRNDLYLFGRCYRHGDRCITSGEHQQQDQQDSEANVDVDVLREFLIDFRSVMFFCYRKDFPPLEPSLLTSDVGWGCMLRTGQMMLAKALVHHMLGRGWRLGDKDRLDPFSWYRKIVRWFADVPQRPAHYSLHNLVRVSNEQLGASADEAAGGSGGEWFSPTRVLQILKHIVCKHSPDQLTMYVAMDAVVYKDEITALCTVEPVALTPSSSPSVSGLFDTEDAPNGHVPLSARGGATIQTSKPPAAHGPSADRLSAASTPSAGAAPSASSAASAPDARCPTPADSHSRNGSHGASSDASARAPDARSRESERQPPGVASGRGSSASDAWPASGSDAIDALSASTASEPSSLLESSAFEIVRRSTLGPDSGDMIFASFESRLSDINAFDKLVASTCSLPDDVESNDPSSASPSAYSSVSSSSVASSFLAGDEAARSASGGSGISGLSSDAAADVPPTRDELRQPIVRELRTWRPVFIAVPVRLGVDRLNKVYIEGLKYLLRVPQSLGIIGGRPKQSYYFVGYQDDDIIYLDPHVVRPSVKPDKDFSDESYHVEIPQKMPFENLDPSLAVGFFCSCRAEFDDLCDRIGKMDQSYPIVSIADISPYADEADSDSAQ